MSAADLRFALIAAVLVIVGLLAVTSTGAPAPVSQGDLLPPCPTEDSIHCYWDADTMGNGLGDDVVTR